MTWKCHSRIPQTNSRHREEEVENKNSNITSRIQQKSSNQLCLPPRDDCNTRMETKFCTTKQGPNIKLQQTMGATINKE